MSISNTAHSSTVQQHKILLGELARVIQQIRHLRSVGVKGNASLEAELSAETSDKQSKAYTGTNKEFPSKCDDESNVNVGIRSKSNNDERQILTQQSKVGEKLKYNADEHCVNITGNDKKHGHIKESGKYEIIMEEEKKFENNNSDAEAENVKPQRKFYNTRGRKKENNVIEEEKKFANNDAAANAEDIKPQRKYYKNRGRKKTTFKTRAVLNHELKAKSSESQQVRLDKDTQTLKVIENHVRLDKDTQTLKVIENHKLLITNKTQGDALASEKHLSDTKLPSESKKDEGDTINNDLNRCSKHKKNNDSEKDENATNDCSKEGENSVKKGLKDNRKDEEKNMDIDIENQQSFISNKTHDDGSASKKHLSDTKLPSESKKDEGDTINNNVNRCLNHRKRDSEKDENATNDCSKEGENSVKKGLKDNRKDEEKNMDIDIENQQSFISNKTHDDGSASKKHLSDTKLPSESKKDEGDTINNDLNRCSKHKKNNDSEKDENATNYCSKEGENSVKKEINDNRKDEEKNMDIDIENQQSFISNKTHDDGSASKKHLSDTKLPSESKKDEGDTINNDLNRCLNPRKNNDSEKDENATNDCPKEGENSVKKEINDNRKDEEKNMDIDIENQHAFISNKTHDDGSASEKHLSDTKLPSESKKDEGDTINNDLNRCSKHKKNNDSEKDENATNDCSKEGENSVKKEINDNRKDEEKNMDIDIENQQAFISNKTHDDGSASEKHLSDTKLPSESKKDEGDTINNDLNRCLKHKKNNDSEKDENATNDCSKEGENSVKKEIKDNCEDEEKNMDLDSDFYFEKLSYVDKENRMQVSDLEKGSSTNDTVRNSKQIENEIKQIMENIRKSDLFLNNQTDKTVVKDIRNCTDKKVDVQDCNHEDGLETAENIDDSMEIDSFHFNIEKDVWNNIKPQPKYLKGNRKVERMSGDWTNTFYNIIKCIKPGCILRFKNHYVKLSNSRKIKGNYFTADAYCAATGCKAKFFFSIENEPTSEEEVTVLCMVKGLCLHNSTDVNRRNLNGIRRQEVENLLKGETVTNVFYNQLSNNEKQMMNGNYSDVPTPATLRKLVSDILKKEQLHDNIIKEIEILKNAYESDGSPFIHDIGVNPFCVIMQTNEQAKLMKDLAKENKLDLFIDATGSIIAPIPDQKRPYLYSIIVQPNSKLPPLSVADMLSTQHTIPRIEFFLLQIKRAMVMHGSNNLKRVNKIETDFSYAIMQACLHVFSNCDIKTYLSKSFELTTTSKDLSSDLTILHLCSAHIFKDFTRQFKAYIGQVSKPKNVFLKKSFSALQNCTSLEEGQNIFRDLCTICLSERTTEGFIGAKKRMSLRFKSEEIDLEDEEDEDNMENISEYIVEDDLEVQKATIKEASPYNKAFRKIREAVETKLKLDIKEECSESNELLCPQMIDCLLDRFMYLFPLWSGLHLEETRSRATNSPVENYFRSIKHDLGLKKYTRPSKLIIKLKQITGSRIKELSFPAAREGKKRKLNKPESAKITLSEEVWKVKKIKKAKYQPPLKKKTIKAFNNIDLPPVPGWGANLDKCIEMFNTCTIDNGLTILYLQYLENQEFCRILNEEENDFYKSLLTVLKLMKDQDFDEAKLVWYGMFEPIIKKRIDLYGDETDFFIKHIDKQWKSTVVSNCNQKSCTKPYQENDTIQGVNICFPSKVTGTQEMINIWLRDYTPCTAPLIEVDSDSNDDSIKSSAHKDRCTGERKNIRTVLRSSPVLCIRVLEHFSAKKITLQHILNQDILYLNSSMYVFAGITMHRKNHYAAVVSFDRRKFWYDGLVGKLSPMPLDIASWKPVHVLYCQCW